MPGETEWGWYAGRHVEPENYSLGPFETRDDAIAEARSDFGSDGDGFTVIEACKGEFAPPSAKRLMEEMLERWGDDDMGREDYPDFEGTAEAVTAAESDLDVVLAAWFERHKAIMPSPWCFDSSRHEEYFPTADEEA